MQSSYLPCCYSTMNGSRPVFRTSPCSRNGNATTSILLLVRSKCFRLLFFGRDLANATHPSFPRPFQLRFSLTSPWFACNEITCIRLQFVKTSNYTNLRTHPLAQKLELVFFFESQSAANLLRQHDISEKHNLK